MCVFFMGMGSGVRFGSLAGFDWVYTDLATLRIRGMLTCKPQLLKPVRMDG